MTNMFKSISSFRNMNTIHSSWTNNIKKVCIIKYNDNLNVFVIINDFIIYLKQIKRKGKPSLQQEQVKES